METEDVKNAVKKTQDYIRRLSDLRKTVGESITQVTQSAGRSAEDIDRTFDILSKSLLEALNARKLELHQQITSITDEALTELHHKDQMLADKLTQLNKLDSDGQTILLNQPQDQHALKTFISSSSSFDCLPEVPTPSEVPYIGVYFRELSSLAPFLNSLRSHGHVSSLGPFQIVESVEKPGALAMRWEELKEADGCSDVDDPFILQCCQGDVTKDDKLAADFRNVYVGLDTCCIVRNLQPHVEYTFRVCRGSSEDAEWSHPYVARTALIPYEWELDNDAYCIHDDGRIAWKVLSRPSILYSFSPQFQCKHSLQFRILETPPESHASLEDEGLGVSLWNGQSNKLLQPGVILLNIDGCVFVDGMQMTTRLPNLYKGSVVTFESEPELPNSKMRIMVNCEGKQVTYDWRLDHLVEPDKATAVYFFVHFRHKDWKVIVE